ncbi:Fc.00g050760.m01.CDS01 [Cosmosporella sp. VM-42]
MPLPFSLVCDLLEQAHKLSVARKCNAHVVTSWFARYRDRIDAHDSNLAALLSTLLPDKRTDRVYCIQATRLEKIIGRAFFLGSSRIAELAVYKQPGLGLDLGDCVARLLTVTPSPACNKDQQVAVEEIDEILHSIASRVKWSSPSIRASQATLTQGNRGDLENIYRRLSSKEAKWFTRLILKDYQPLTLDPHLIYRLCDPILPSVLKVQDDFAAAINTVQTVRGKLLPNSARRASRGQILGSIKPQFGIKVGRQSWLKGRSIKHCLDMGHGRMSVEEKIDGEYCQIHIDLSKGANCIQIFSKSGKDSTEDREGLHGIILESLHVNKPGAKLAKGCILEGELVVYHDLKQKVLPFHQIRKHVSRRGRFMNTEQDSLPGPHEHLMIIYYDILRLDDQSLINVRHWDRFMILSNLINCRQGYAELVQRQVVDFDHSLGASNLRKAFATAILGRKEGLVLKPDDPYFDFSDERRQFSSCCIKLKKEYIGNFGDVGDFAVVGARYDPTKAKSYKIPDLKWTHFYLGCLDNREEVKQWGATPEFTVVNVVELNETMLKDVVCFANPMPVTVSQSKKLNLKLTPGVQKNTPMSVVFTNPLVFDLRCFSFDKEGNTGFWNLRFPMVTKVHFDRDFTDTVSFEQLQSMANDATTAPELEDSQENLEWIAKLEAADPRGIAVDAISQLTMTTMPTPSPRRSIQNTSELWSPTSPTAIRASIEEPMSPIQQRSRGSCPQTLPLGPPLYASSNAARESIEQPPTPIERRNTAARPQRVPLGPPFATPPTSSAPVASTPQQSDKPAGHKRVLRDAKSPSHKRWKPDKTSSHKNPTSVHQPAISQSRMPLVNITGNSQTTMSSFSSNPPIEASVEKLEVIDLTSSPESSFTTAVTTHIRSSQTDGPTSFNQTTTAITLPDETGDDILENHDTSTVNRAASRSGARNKCRYAGHICRLAKSEILISPDIFESNEAQTLLENHGIDDPVTELDEWLEKDERSAKLTTWQPGPTKILFVDSVDKPYGTKLLLEYIEEERKLLPEDRRDYMTVYDWRALKYITIMEDESITEKYYDGFRDPWRRWYCGIV